MPEGKNDLAAIAICAARMAIEAIYTTTREERHDHARDQTLALQAVRMVALETDSRNELPAGCKQPEYEYGTRDNGKDS